MEIIDRKFKILAVNVVNGKIYDEKNAVLFTAKDKAFPATLEFYKNECRRIGCEPEQIESAGLLRQRVDDFQISNISHVPDLATEAEVRRCVDGEGV